MEAWFVDRALPGLLSGALLTIAVAVSHVLTRRRDARAEQRQRDNLERVTAAQTATITGASQPQTVTEGTSMTGIPSPDAGADPKRKEPHFGRTRHGLPVHLRTHDHLPDHSAYARFNKRCAIWITTHIGSMSAFWIFTALSMFVAPSCLYAAGYIDWKSFITSFGFELLATLILSTWLELALMPAIMVGQNLASEASDARASKQFEDTEIVVDRLDEHTDGGIKAVLDAVAALSAKIDGKDATP